MITMKEYDAEVHGIYQCLGLLPELAEKVTNVECVIDGEPQAEVSVILQPKSTQYRGDLLIGAVKSKEKQSNKPGSYLCGFVELWDVRPCRGLQPDDWKRAVIPPKADRVQWWAWFVRNPRRVVEVPQSFKKGYFKAIIPKDEITEYPTQIVIGAEEWTKLRKKYGI